MEKENQITQADIAHLASLARISVSEAELTSFETELSSIMKYVSEITTIAADETDAEPSLGARHNVFREDVVTNESGEYTEAILDEMPAREGQHLLVKKILSHDE